MRALLRLIVLCLGLFVLVPLLFLAWHGVGLRPKDGWTALRAAGTAGFVLVLLAFIAVGIFAMHRLWHFKNAGRIAAAGLFGILPLPGWASESDRDASRW